MKSVENENIRRHKEYTISLVQQVVNETKDTGFEEFLKNGPLKEMIYSQLDEIGEAASEMIDITDDEDMRQAQRIIFQKLTLLRNARTIQKTEKNIEQVWKVVKIDLPKMEKELTLTD